MNGDMILDAMDYVGDDLIDDYFRLRAQYEKKKAKRWRKRRWISLAAACLAAVMIGTYAMQYIPKEYDLDYVFQTEYDQMAAGGGFMPQNCWIYYVNEHGWTRRERVHFEDPRFENKFMTWKHLNGIGDDVRIIDTEYITNASGLDKHGQVITMYPVDCTIAFITISKSIKRYDHWEKMIDSLRKTILQHCDSCQIMLK